MSDKNKFSPVAMQDQTWTELRESHTAIENLNRKLTLGAFAGSAVMLTDAEAILAATLFSVITAGLIERKASMAA